MCTLEGACVTEKGFGSDGCDGEGAGVPRVGCHGEVWGGGEGARWLQHLVCACGWV